MFDIETINQDCAGVFRAGVSSEEQFPPALSDFFHISTRGDIASAKSENNLTDI